MENAGKNKRVAIIGAGCSGIAALKNCLQAGLDEVVCFEQNDDIGGNWIFSSQPSHSSVCETTHIISSKSLSQYLDFPMPDEYPDYPSHEQVLSYFRSYARHFGLYPYIRFNTRVDSIRKTKTGEWEIRLGDGTEEFFDFLLVANGHHSVPRHPELPGNFSGTYLHAHAYKTNKPFRDQKVLVVGSGNSGCDCAVEISRVASRVSISMRRPHYIIPKFFLGKPTDTFNQGLSRLPRFLVDWVHKLTLRIQVGDYRQYGLENPDFPVTRDHPTLNSELLYKIRHGKVHPRRGIRKIEGKRITFSDGLTEEYDVILAATGYKISFPFFDPAFINYEHADRVPLYLRMFHPEHSRLIFIGLTQPQGAVWPLSDAQSKLAANYIAGRWSLPKDFARQAEQESDALPTNFLQAKRHVIEVHFHPYLKKLLNEIPKEAPKWGDHPPPAASKPLQLTN
jgi:hypothetical protein